MALRDSTSAARVCICCACAVIVLVCSAMRALMVSISRWTASATTAAPVDTADSTLPAAMEMTGEATAGDEDSGVDCEIEVCPA